MLQAQPWLLYVFCMYVHVVAKKSSCDLQSALCSPAGLTADIQACSLVSSMSVPRNHCICTGVWVWVWVWVCQMGEEETPQEIS